GASLEEQQLALHRIDADRGDELDRDRPIEQAVVREIDLPAGPAAEGPHEPIFVELVGRRPTVERRHASSTGDPVGGTPSRTFSLARDPRGTRQQASSTSAG